MRDETTRRDLVFIANVLARDSIRFLFYDRYAVSVTRAEAKVPTLEIEFYEKGESLGKALLGCYGTIKRVNVSPKTEEAVRAIAEKLRFDKIVERAETLVNLDEEFGKRMRHSCNPAEAAMEIRYSSYSDFAKLSEIAVGFEY